MTPDEYYEAKELIETKLDVAHAHLLRMFNNEGAVLIVACAQMICDRAVTQGTTVEEVLEMISHAYRNSEQRWRRITEGLEKLDE